MAAKAAELQVVVGADTSQAESGLQSLSGKISGIAGGLGKLAAAGIGAVVAGFGAVTVAAAGFEKSLSGISAVSGATADEMGKISALALQLGKDTSFSAGEAAAGIEELVKGGLSLEDIFSGGAKAALDLAAAGSLSVADAAEIAANAVGQFGLKGAELGAAADLIAGAANASQISVTDFKFSLAAVGAVANLVGFDFQDTAVAIAEMGRQGIKGSDAGTSLKAMLMNLQPSTKKASAEMRNLGLVTEDGKNQFFDAAGNVKKMADVQGILQNATKNLTAEQKLASLEILFGSDGIRAATVLAKQGAEGYNEMATAMGKVTAADVARERLNNLAGSVEMLKGSLETAAISVGLKFTPALKDLADRATESVNAAIPELERLAGVAVTAGQTFMQAFAGKWSPDGVDEAGNIVWVDPFVENVGKAGVAIKTFADYLSSPAFQGSAGGAAKNMADFNLELDKLLGKLPQVQASSSKLGEFFNLEVNSAALTAMVERLNAVVDIAGVAAAAVGKAFESMGRSQVGDVLGAKAAMDEAKAALTQIPAIWTTAVQSGDERIRAAKAGTAAAAQETFAAIPEAATASMNVVSSEVTAGFGTLAGDFSTGWDTIVINTTTELAALPPEATATMNLISSDVTAGFGTLAGDFSTGWQTIVTNTEAELPKVSASVETNMAAAEASAATGGAAIVTTLTASFGEAAAVAEAEMPRLSAAVEAESGPAVAAAASVGEAIVAGVEPPLQSLPASGHSAGAGLVGAFVSGVRARLGEARAATETMVEQIRALLPGSDAKEGPLSDITASGAALPATFGAGIDKGSPEATAAATRMAKSVIQIMAEELGANDAKIGAAAKGVLQRVIDSGIDLKTALQNAGKASGVDFASALVMELGANDAKVGAAVKSLLKRATDSGVDLTTMSADVRDLGVAFQETGAWAGEMANQAARLDVTLRGQIEPATILTTQAMTRLSQVLGPIERQVAGGAISMDTLHFKLVDLARATGLAVKPWDDYSAGLIDINEAMMRVVMQSADAGPQFEALRQSLGTTNTITDEGTLKWLQLALALQQTPASTKVATTALQGVGAAAGSAFANVGTGSKTAFADVTKSATAALPKVTTGLDGVGKEAVGTTADVDKFGKEIETLKATKGAVDGLSQSWRDLAVSISQALQKLIEFNKESAGGGGQGSANVEVLGNFAIPAFAGGGVKHGDGLAYLHDRERVLTMPQQHNLARLVASPPAGSDGGARIINVTVPITGSLIQQSEAEQWIAAAVRSAMDDGRF